MHAPSLSVGLTLSFDLGGSHVAAWCSRAPLTLETVANVPLDHTSSKDTVLDAIGRAGQQALALAGAEGSAVQAIGFATPGPFDHSAGSSRMPHKFISIRNYPLRAFLGKTFTTPAKNIRFLNDADAFLLGELAADPRGRAMGLTLGTGIGSAFTVDGKLVHNGQGVPPGGEVFCIPWHSGIIEDAISTHGILRLHRNLGGALTTVRAISETACQDAISAQTMLAFGTSLGKVMNYLSGLFQPDTIVIGGSITKGFATFSPALLATLTGGVRTVRVSHFPELAALAGASSFAQAPPAKISSTSALESC